MPAGKVPKIGDRSCGNLGGDAKSTRRAADGCAHLDFAGTAQMPVIPATVRVVNDLLTLASVESINDMSTSAAVCLATAIEQWVDKLEAAVSVASKRTMSAPLARKLCAFEKEVTELLTPETGRRVVSLSIDRALESALERCLDDATLLGSLECVMEVLEPYW
eukprot:CAMPEP_0174852546 /NCGR_PEP_ID=MMETSP1114-20130205/25780_1 /TAXON_ID=312471 /ORGANISM="Neobodo designis, Strain CCAP 1951/1" /LENGTH=162 /DNA_ID=CAMNT_0016087151 /DNA_START=91 /DNA_END=577 /DNA_ORIENTATION=+